MTNEKKIESLASRRNFAIGGGLLGVAAAAVRGQAQTQMPSTQSDIALLNYALTLEHLEANFYTQGLSRISQSDFASRASFREILGAGTVEGVYTNLGRIRDHEVAHVEALQTAIRGLGGTPVAACTYNFSFGSPDEFLQTAEMLEELGVQAYDGALGMLASAALKRAGASIATVEARHAAYLSLVNSAIPFPRAFDQTKTMQEVLNVAAPFLTNCPTVPGNGGGPGPGNRTTAAVLLPKNLSTASQQVTLDASQSTSATDQPLTYLTRSIGRSATVLRADTTTPAVQFGGGAGEYRFELTVTDSSGNTSTDTITINYIGR